MTFPDLEFHLTPLLESDSTRSILKSRLSIAPSNNPDLADTVSDWGFWNWNKLKIAFDSHLCRPADTVCFHLRIDLRVDSMTRVLSCWWRCPRHQRRCICGFRQGTICCSSRHSIRTSKTKNTLKAKSLTYFVIKQLNLKLDFVIN